MKKLQEFLEVCEEHAHLSPAEVAEKLNISPSYYSLMKHGRKYLTEEFAEKLIQLFDIPEDMRYKFYFYIFDSSQHIKISNKTEVFNNIINLIKKDLNIE